MALEGDEAQLEIAHVLLIDIVGYSKKLVDEQTALVTRLNHLVRGTPQFRAAEAAGKLIAIPSGDGMALVFFTAPDAPVRCAIEINQADLDDPKIELRMGVHSGPVDRVRDVNQRTNIAGVGINMAQRVMDCGDAGHILLSRRIADDIGQYSRWKAYLHDLGEVEVKHGVRIGVVNFYSDTFGNPALPARIAAHTQAQNQHAEQQRSRQGRKRKLLSVALTAAMIIGLSVCFVAYRMSQRLGAAERLAKAAAEIPARSVAVLPFENVSRDADSALIVTGIQEEIITRLAKLAALKVIARASTKEYESRPGNIADIAKQLGVATLLEGSVQKIGDDVRVSVRLIKADTAANLWADSFDRKLIDVFGVESEVAMEIATALRTTLTPDEKARVEKAPTRNLEAWAAYLKTTAMSDAHASSIPAQLYADIRAQLERALVLDPEFALAQAHLSINESAWFVDVDRAVAHKTNAKVEADKAIALDPNLPEAHMALARAYQIQRNYPEAANEYAVASRLAPNDAELLRNTAMLMRRQGHWKDALATIKKAVSLNPRSKLTIDWLGNIYAQLQQWRSAKEAFERSLTLAPSISPEAVQSARGMVAWSDSMIVGNFEPFRRFVASENDEATEDRCYIAMLDRDFEAAERLLSLTNLDDFGVLDTIRGPKNYMAACAAYARGDLVRARQLFQLCLPRAEEAVRADPDEAHYHSFLGLLYAGLGRKEDALREGELAVSMLPESKDAVDAPLSEAALATIYTRVGDTERAITLLQHLLTVPNACNGSISTLDLRTWWEWDPLRRNPRFQKILTGPEPKTMY